MKYLISVLICFYFSINYSNASSPEIEDAAMTQSASNAEFKFTEEKLRFSTIESIVPFTKDIKYTYKNYEISLELIKEEVDVEGLRAALEFAQKDQDVEARKAEAFRVFVKTSSIKDPYYLLRLLGFKEIQKYVAQDEEVMKNLRAFKLADCAEWEDKITDAMIPYQSRNKRATHDSVTHSALPEVELAKAYNYACKIGLNLEVRSGLLMHFLCRIDHKDALQALLSMLKSKELSNHVRIRGYCIPAICALSLRENERLRAKSNFENRLQESRQYLVTASALIASEYDMFKNFFEDLRGGVLVTLAGLSPELQKDHSRELMDIFKKQYESGEKLNLMETEMLADCVLEDEGLEKADPYFQRYKQAPEYWLFLLKAGQLDSAREIILRLGNNLVGKIGLFLLSWKEEKFEDARRNLIDIHTQPEKPELFFVQEFLKSHFMMTFMDDILKSDKVSDEMKALFVTIYLRSTPLGEERFASCLDAIKDPVSQAFVLFSALLYNMQERTYSESELQLIREQADEIIQKFPINMNVLKLVSLKINPENKKSDKERHKIIEHMIGRKNHRELVRNNPGNAEEHPPKRLVQEQVEGLQPLVELPHRPGVPQPAVGPLRGPGAIRINLPIDVDVMPEQCGYGGNAYVNWLKRVLETGARKFYQEYLQNMEQNLGLGQEDSRDKWKYDVAAISDGSCNMTEDESKKYQEIVNWIQNFIADATISDQEASNAMIVIEGFRKLHEHNADICREIIESNRVKNHSDVFWVQKQGDIILHPEQGDSNLEMRAHSFFMTLVSAFEALRDGEVMMQVRFVKEAFNPNAPCFEARSREIDKWHQDNRMQLLSEVIDDKQISENTAQENILAFVHELIDNVEKGITPFQELKTLHPLKQEVKGFDPKAPGLHNKDLIKRVEPRLDRLGKYLQQDVETYHVVNETYEKAAQQTKEKLVGKQAQDKVIDAKDVDAAFGLLGWDIIADDPAKADDDFMELG